MSTRREVQRWASLLLEYWCANPNSSDLSLPHHREALATWLLKHGIAEASGWEHGVPNGEVRHPSDRKKS